MKKFLFFVSVTLVSLGSIAQLPNINLVQVVGTGLSSPVDLQNCGDERLFVVEQPGRIKIVSKTGTINPTAFLDISSRVKSTGDEQGLLGLAFSPNYKQDGFFYVNYIYDNGTNTGATRISRFSVLPNDSNRADANSERILLTFNQPYTNHNGGCVFFGKDGYLYDSQGDGGSQNDPNGNGQNTNVYLAKLLRFDVSDPDTTYTIPASNPFYGQAGKKGEIWAYGLRNPWRCSVDRITGDIWIGDVGQGTWEEVDFQPVNSTGGENYGWRCREGLHACSSCTTTGCPSTGFTDPVFEYQHSTQNGCSLTGGYVYRGTQYNSLWGRYVCTDYCSGQFYTVKQTGTNSFDADTLNNLTNYQYTSLGQDNSGELYVLYRGSGTGGRVYRLTETTNCNPIAFITLKDTLDGCSPVTIAALKGDTLSYQWYNSNGMINGANSYQYAVQQEGWYKVKVSKTLYAGCEAMSDSVYVAVHDTTALAPCNCILPFCNNTLGANSLSGYISPAGGTYTGTGVSNNQFTPLGLSAGSYAVTYSYTNQFGCASQTGFALQVNDTTALTVNASNLKYCVEDSAVSLNGIVTPIGGVYYSGNVTNDSIFNPAVAGVGVIEIPYAYTNNNNCQSVVRIYPEVGGATVLSKNIDSTACNNEPAFDLSGFYSPIGGTFTGGNGLSGSSFDPAVAGVGLHNVYYSYTNTYGCVSADSFTINVSVCSAVHELKNEFSFNVFPNPSKGNFSLNIQVSKTENAELIITDVIGKICFSKNYLLEPSKPVIAIETAGLAKGTYTVQLKTAAGNAVRSLVIE